MIDICVLALREEGTLGRRIQLFRTAMGSDVYVQKGWLRLRELINVRKVRGEGGNEGRAL